MARLTIGKENSAPIELHYEDHGAGKPVVLIHGWPLSARSWESQVPALVAGGHRVIAYDRRGFGDSSRPFTGYDYDTFAADLHALLEHLDLREVTLVGFSMGGGEVARYVGRYGTKRVAKVVFAAAVPPFLLKTKEHPEGALDVATLMSFEDALKADRIAFIDQFATNFFSAKGKLKASEAQRRFAVEIASFASPKGTLECVSAFGKTDFRPDLAKITVPTLVIHGDSDAIVPFENSGKLTAETVAGAKLVLLKDAPHGCNATHAAEFNRALLDFLGR